MNLLVLYDDASSFIGTVQEYLEAIRLHSRHTVMFASPTNGAVCPHDLNRMFDAMLITYSVRLAYNWHLSPAWATAIEAFHGPKLLSIQDEYDNTETMRTWVRRLGIRHVFTCVPDQYIDSIYGTLRPEVSFSNVLTGYVPDKFEDAHRFARLPPLSKRSIMIGYRGRSLPWYYGDLGREKLIIGQRMHDECQRRGILADIAWTEDRRIYGDAWPAFISSCRATLASESGSNVFDENGAIRTAINAHLQAEPETPYEAIHARYLAEHDGTRARMNQISPRIFESIAMGTALILFEGSYSGVVQPDRHFITLKKDFSNLDEVFQRLADVQELEAMAARAFTDIIMSGRWSYRTFVQHIDAVLDNFCSKHPKVMHPPLLVVVARPSSPRNYQPDPHGVAGNPITNIPVHADDRLRFSTLMNQAKPLPPPSWHRRLIPEPIHRRISPLVRPIYYRLLALLGR